MRVLVVAWEPVALPRVATWPRLRAAILAMHRAGDDVTVLADPATLARIGDTDGVARVVAHEAAPYLDLTETRTMALAGGLALQSAGHGLAASADVVHGLGWTATHGAVHLARLAGRPLVATVLALPPPDHDAATTFARQTTGWLAGEARAVVVPSDRLRRRLAAALDLDDARVHTAPYPRGTSSAVDLDALAGALAAAHAAARG